MRKLEPTNEFEAPKTKYPWHEWLVLDNQPTELEQGTDYQVPEASMVRMINTAMQALNKRNGTAYAVVAKAHAFRDVLLFQVYDPKTQLKPTLPTTDTESERATQAAHAADDQYIGICEVCGERFRRQPGFENVHTRTGSFAEMQDTGQTFFLVHPEQTTKEIPEKD